MLCMMNEKQCDMCIERKDSENYWFIFRWCSTLYFIMFFLLIVLSEKENNFETVIIYTYKCVDDALKLWCTVEKSFAFK